MSTAQQPQLDPQSQYADLLKRTLQACLLAQGAAGVVADILGGADPETCCRAVDDAERQLDRLDNEVDLAVTSCIANVTPAQARELLTCMKIVIDIERIGDLLSSVARYVQALGHRTDADDVADLVKMSTTLEKMLIDVHGAFLSRKVDLAIAALRSDSQIDRLRNLMMIRHLEQTQTRITQDSVQVLFVAQSLERAGDHVKNVAEEICHFVTGQTLRHALRQNDMPEEQMYLRWLKMQIAGKRTDPPTEARSSRTAG